MKYIFKHAELTVNVIREIYEAGRETTETIKKTIRITIRFHKLLPKWNYKIKRKSDT